MEEFKDLQSVVGSVPDDLSRLPSLEEDRVRDALRKRFEGNSIYTHINSLLGTLATSVLLQGLSLIQTSLFHHAVAMNPYKKLPLYDQANLEAYNQYGVTSPGPHVFGVAAATYRGLLGMLTKNLVDAACVKTFLHPGMVMYFAASRARNNASVLGRPRAVITGL